MLPHNAFVINILIVIVWSTDDGEKKQKKVLFNEQFHIFNEP